MTPYAPAGSTYAFGPGGLTPAVRAIIYVTVAAFVLSLFAPPVFRNAFGLIPQDIVERLQVWRIGTYLFLHGGFGHILFNMLFVWLFGVDLERRWGSAAFAKYYLITGLGAGLTVLAVSLLPLASVQNSYVVPTIGASGAVYGLLLAWALVFPHRQILFMLIIPIPARVFAGIMGAIAFLSAMGANQAAGDVSHVAHLGGLIVGWLYLKGPTNLRGEMAYRWTRWRMGRMRRRFDVRRGGRDDDWRNRVH